MQYYFGTKEQAKASYTGEHIKESLSEGKRQGQLCIGGDRWLSEDSYAPTYAKYLEAFYIKKKESPFLTICEVGILKGQGLAIWDKLFPKSTLIGLDIDISNFLSNFNRLKASGAFADQEVNSDSNKKIKQSSINAFLFDSWNKEYNQEKLKTLFSDTKINICIDDGDHQDIPQINTFETILPYLANDFVYFIEDIKTARSENLKNILSSKFPWVEFTIAGNKNNMIVATRKIS